MRFDEITISQVRMDLKLPFRAGGRSTQERNHVLVRASCDGAVGWGECAAPGTPDYIGETTGTVWHILVDFLAPMVLGREWSTVDELAAGYADVKGNTIAKAGVEMAAWDMLTRAEQRPLAAALGGTRSEIHSGVSLGMEQDRQRLLDLVGEHVAQGYRRVKLKIARGHDVEVVEHVRRAFPQLPLMVDANSAYTLDDRSTLQRLDAFDLLMIEQPLAADDLLGHADLQRTLATPICLDESIRSVEDAKVALALGSCRVINVKVARLGGLREAKRVHDLCLERNIPVWCGGMHDYGIGRAANVALCSLPGFTIAGDVSGSDKYYEVDLVDPPIVASRGAIAVPTGAGLGYAVDEARVRARTVRQVVFRR